MIYPFTEQEAAAAAEAWNANCGPLSLAFALGVKPEAVRDAIPGFAEKGYTNPSMMKAALASMGRTFFSAVADRENLFREQTALVRVQWTGPWTAPGANAKWAYRQSHWVVTWRAFCPDCRGRGALYAPLDEGGVDCRCEESTKMVFDCNGGIRTFASWEREIVPVLTKLYPRADGGWFPTHIWRLAK